MNFDRSSPQILIYKSEQSRLSFQISVPVILVFLLLTIFYESNSSWLQFLWALMWNSSSQGLLCLTYHDSLCIFLGGGLSPRLSRSRAVCASITQMILDLPFHLLPGCTATRELIKNNFDEEHKYWQFVSTTFQNPFYLFIFFSTVVRLFSIMLMD